MRIGIDIDGVLTDIERWKLDYGSKFYYEKYNKRIVNPKGYETIEVFNSTDKEDDEFWRKYFIDYAKNVQMRIFADEVTRKLKEDGHELYIITARGSFLSHSADVMDYELNKKIVIDWLKEKKITYDEIIFSPENKLDICLENKIDIMIEDSPKGIMNIARKIPVICFDAGYNEECKKENIIRCFSWYDIYTKISDLSHDYNNIN